MSILGLAIDWWPDIGLLGGEGEFTGADILGLVFWAFVTPLIVGVIGIAAMAIIGANERINMRATERREAKVCPDCAEAVKGAARVCKHCGHRFEPELGAGA